MVSYTYETYKRVITDVPLALGGIAFIVAVIMICCLRGKAVRIIFPYIKKHGNYTVAFGFILKKGLIILHYYNVGYIFFTVTLIFFNSFLLKTSTRYNPYDYFNCFYDNGTEVGKLTPEEALRLEDRVRCFAWNLDIGEAAGQATGILALTWIAVSTLLYITLHCGLIVKKCHNNKERRKLGICGTCSLVLAGLAVYIVCYGVIPLTVIAINKKWIPDYVSSTQLYLQITLFAITLVTTIFYAYDATKEPENCTDFCQKVVKAKAEESVELHRIRLEMQRAILTKEQAELEKLFKKVEEKDKSYYTHRPDNSEKSRLLEQQILEENGTPKEQNEAQKQYKTDRTNVEKNIREFEQNLEKNTIPKIKDFWKDATGIEEESFKRQKAKLKLDIKKNRLKQDKALGIESEDDSIEEEEKEYNDKYLDLDRREAECQNKKIKLVDEDAKQLFESKMSLEEEKTRLKKERQRLGQKEKDDINWEKEWCELDIENSRLEEEKIKLIGTNVLRELVEWECKVALAREAAFYMTEEEMKKITEAAFYRVIKRQREELPPHTTDPVLLGKLFLPYMLKKPKDRLAYWCIRRASS